MPQNLDTKDDCYLSIAHTLPCFSPPPCADSNLVVFPVSETTNWAVFLPVPVRRVVVRDPDTHLSIHCSVPIVLHSQDSPIDKDGEHVAAVTTSPVGVDTAG